MLFPANLLGSIEETKSNTTKSGNAEKREKKQPRLNKTQKGN